MRPARLGFGSVVLSAQLALFALPSGAASDGLMAMVCEVDGQADLFVWDPGGGAPRRLTATPADELRPSLAPDRRSVVYTDSAGLLWRLATDGEGEPQRLSGDDEANLLLQPAVSPDGRAMLLVRREERSRDETDLAIRELPATGKGDAPPPAAGPAWEKVAGAQPTWILPMVSSQFSPAYAPDGRRFAFTHLHARWTGSIISEIWEARLDHSYGRQLTLLDGFCDEPAWSPSGEEVAFACDRDGRYDVYAVVVASREVRRLTDAPSSDADPVYAPDGRRLAFITTRWGPSAIAVLDLGSGEVRRLAPFADARPCRDVDWR